MVMDTLGCPYVKREGENYYIHENRIGAQIMANEPLLTGVGDIDRLIGSHFSIDVLGTLIRDDICPWAQGDQMWYILLDRLAPGMLYDKELPYRDIYRYLILVADSERHREHFRSAEDILNLVYCKFLSGGTDGEIHASNAAAAYLFRNIKYTLQQAEDGDRISKFENLCWAAVRWGHVPLVIQCISVIHDIDNHMGPKLLLDIVRPKQLWMNVGLTGANLTMIWQTLRHHVVALSQGDDIEAQSSFCANWKTCARYIITIAATRGVDMLNTVCTYYIDEIVSMFPQLVGYLDTQDIITKVIYGTYPDDRGNYLERTMRSSSALTVQNIAVIDYIFARYHDQVVFADHEYYIAASYAYNMRSSEDEALYRACIERIGIDAPNVGIIAAVQAVYRGQLTMVAVTLLQLDYRVRTILIYAALCGILEARVLNDRHREERCHRIVRPLINDIEYYEPRIDLFMRFEDVVALAINISPEYLTLCSGISNQHFELYLSSDTVLQSVIITCINYMDITSGDSLEYLSDVWDKSNKPTTRIMYLLRLWHLALETAACGDLARTRAFLRFVTGDISNMDHYDDDIDHYSYDSAYIDLTHLRPDILKAILKHSLRVFGDPRKLFDLDHIMQYAWNSPQYELIKKYNRLFPRH